MGWGISCWARAPSAAPPKTPGTINRVNEHLVWANPLAPRWRTLLIVLMVAVVFGILAAMATQHLNTWIGIVLMLLIAIVINMIHRLGTFMMVDEGGLHFGAFPRPQDVVPLRDVKRIGVADLPSNERITSPWGSTMHGHVSVVDANQSTRAIVLELRDGRTVKIGTGNQSMRAQEFVETLKPMIGRKGKRG